MTATFGRRESAMSPKVQKENGRTWIQGVPTLAWSKDSDTTFAGALAAALTWVALGKEIFNPASSGLIS